MAENKPGPRLPKLGEFQEDPSGWMEVAHYTEQSLLLTKRGRFVALVEPLTDEGKVIAAAIDHMVESGELSLKPAGPTYTSEAVRQMVGLGAVAGAEE